MVTNPRPVIFALVVILSMIPSLSMAADPAVIRAPVFKTHRFMDAKNIGAFSIAAIIMAADLATTHRALEVPGTYEANPLMRNQGTAIAMKVATVGAGIGLAYMCHKSGHHRAERLLPLFMGVPSAIAATHNAGIR